MTLKMEMLRCFSAVAQAGNLQEAANRLGRTQSALSMTLKQLEAHLGQRLFESDRKNRLTPLGVQVLDLANKQVREFDSTVRAIESSANAPAGLVRVAAIPSVAGRIFPPAIEAVTGRHRELRIELRDRDTPGVIESMILGLSDLGVASRYHALNGVQVAPLFADGFGLICAHSHPFAKGSKAITIADLDPDEFIHNSLCDQIQHPDFADLVRLTRVSLHNTYSLLAMVETGNWITILPHSVSRLMPDRLRFLGLPELSETRKVFLYKRQQPAFPAFVDALADQVIHYTRLLETQPG